MAVAADAQVGRVDDVYPTVCRGIQQRLDQGLERRAGGPSGDILRAGDTSMTNPGGGPAARPQSKGLRVLPKGLRPRWLGVQVHTPQPAAPAGLGRKVRRR